MQDPALYSGTPAPRQRSPGGWVARIKRLYAGFWVCLLLAFGVGLAAFCGQALWGPVPRVGSPPPASAPGDQARRTPPPTFSPVALAQRQQVFEQVWELVNTRYAYTDFRGLDWPAVHKQYAPLVDAATDPADFYDVMAVMIYELNDGHSAFLDPHQAEQHYSDQQGVGRWVASVLHPRAQRLSGTNIVYLNLPSFEFYGVAIEVRDALLNLAKTGPIEGLIIDLRVNGGGLLADLEATTRLFVDGGKMGYEVDRAGRQPILITRGGTLPALRDKPIVVLVSDQTESAAERFAVAIQSSHRGTILGIPTAGNTESVGMHRLSDGSLLALAEAQYLLPDGVTSIEDIGLIPDVVLDRPWRGTPLAEDPQVQAALRQIQGK